MILSSQTSCDVLVIGSGIAGIRAALAAASDGCKVILTSSANIFSGSSFFPGTWGFGLIGPESPADEADLAATIQTVGCQMADPNLVQTFVAGIQPAIAEIKAQGIHLHRAANANEREFIPCFDHKHRDWNRIESENARAVFTKCLAELNVETRPFCELLDIHLMDGRVSGAVVHEDGQIRLIACSALVLATGGLGGLFKHRLTSDDVSGSVQSLALKAGAELVNLEFMQIMPGYLSPIYKTVFNEKTFRFAHLTDSFDLPLLLGLDQAQELLDERGGYGPFTSRLKSRLVDLALFKAQQADPGGVTVTFSQDMIDHPPELIRTYFEWLSKAKHLQMSDPAKIGLFAHAANGGIRINPNASAGVKGLFACGEATGGMHGADRIGGLSTANGLVFGGIAGHAAARLAGEQPISAVQSCEFELSGADNTTDLLIELRELMYQKAFVIRTEKGLSEALEQIERLTCQQHLIENPTNQMIAATSRLNAQFLTAKALLTAARLRQESRGSHFRGDFTELDSTQDRPILVSWDQGALQARFRGQSAQ